MIEPKVRGEAEDSATDSPEGNLVLKRSVADDRPPVMEGIPPSGRRVIAASVRGTGHSRRNQPCQDACGWTGARSWLLVAASDGAGSASRSDQGSGHAVEAALAHLRASLESAPADASDEVVLAAVVAAFAHARNALIFRAASEGCSEKEFATTLVLCAVSLGRIVVGQVGDGVVVVRDGESLRAITRPDHGEYYNATFFLTESTWRDHLQTAVLPLGSTAEVVLMTDGLQALAVVLAKNAPHAAFFDLLLGVCRKETDTARLTRRIANLLASPHVCARTDDDKTLIIVLAEATNGGENGYGPNSTSGGNDAPSEDDPVSSNAP